MPTTQPIRVFLCDDVQSFRALMRFVLEATGDIEVVGEAADGASGICGVRESRPDVVLLDLAMPGFDGLQALPAMAATGAQVIALSGFTAERMAPGVLALGARAYLEKGTDLDDIVAAVRSAALPLGVVHAA